MARIESVVELCIHRVSAKNTLEEGGPREGTLVGQLCTTNGTDAFWTTLRCVSEEFGRCRKCLAPTHRNKFATFSNQGFADTTAGVDDIEIVVSLFGSVDSFKTKATFIAQPAVVHRISINAEKSS